MRNPFHCSSLHNIMGRYATYRITSLVHLVYLTIIVVLLLIYYFEKSSNSIRVVHPGILLTGSANKLKTDNWCSISMAELGSSKEDTPFKVLYSETIDGGRWYPKDCKPLQRVAVILYSYGERHQSFDDLMNKLHRMLRRQKLHYTLYVIDQVYPEQYNTGKLRNVGFLESLKHDSFDCFVFHDLNLMPINERNLYMCDNNVRYLSSGDIMNCSKSYTTTCNIEEAVSIGKETYIKLNGYSNRHWGYNSDRHFYSRAIDMGVSVTRPPKNIGQFMALQQNPTNSLSVDLRNLPGDGLTSKQMAYDVMKFKEYRMYTHITVDLGVLKEYGFQWRIKDFRKRGDHV